MSHLERTRTTIPGENWLSPPTNNTERNLRFDEETHGPFGRIDAANDGESQTLFSGSFLVDDGVKRVRDLRPRSARQRTKVGAFLLAGRAGASRRAKIRVATVVVDVVIVLTISFAIR